MSEVVREIEIICSDCLKLKNSIYRNNIVFNASNSQEDTFYRMLDSIINRLESYMEKYKDTNHVISTEMYIFNLEEKNKSVGISYELPLMRKNLNSYYKEFKDIRDEDTNFVAATSMSVLAPLRVISEKLYRELNKQPFDETLNYKMM